VGHPVDALSDEANVAHAALVVTSRRHYQSVSGAADYLYRVADAIGVDGVDLADLVIKASERRASTGRIGFTA
jgi:hypothetical protein